MPQEIINWGLALIASGGGWLLKTMWDDHRKLENKVNTIEVLVVGQYVKREELTAAIGKIEANMDRNFRALFDRLDGKQDK